MQTAKEEVMALLNELPDNSTMEEIQYCLYVRQKIQRGLDDIEAGRVSSQGDVEKRMDKWLAR